uniref:Cytochrome c domain-containing protein n=3 Tax=Aegilops tauschii subsp. strangulata TaxID=200361 RepID=A0A453Q1C6_AEGTS
PPCQEGNGLHSPGRKAPSSVCFHVIPIHSPTCSATLPPSVTHDPLTTPHLSAESEPQQQRPLTNTYPPRTTPVATHTHLRRSSAQVNVPMAAAPTGVACPVYPWPSDAAQRGAKVFMQSDCAACHSALPYAGLRGAAVPGQDAVARTAEILVAAAATEEALPATGMTPPQYTPDLATVATRIQGGLRCNLYSTGTATAPAPVRAMLAGGAAACQELKKSPVWLQFAQAFQAV